MTQAYGEEMVTVMDSPATQNGPLDSQMSFNPVAREMWQARPKRMSQQLPHPVKHVFVTCTNFNMCLRALSCITSIKTLQGFHMDRLGLPDIQYNFCIGGNGMVFVGRDWHSRPTLLNRHRDYTNSSLYIGFLGRPSGDVFWSSHQPAMLYGLESILQYGVMRGYIHPKFQLVSIGRSVEMMLPTLPMANRFKNQRYINNPFRRSYKI